MQSSSLRKVAIRLACAHDEDRQWILAQLQVGERQQIEELLEEISQLGLANDPSVVNSVMRELAVVGKPVAQSEESAALGALLGRAGNPFWAALVLQQQAPAQRRALLSGLASNADIQRWDSVFAKHELPPALIRALRLSLEHREQSHE